MRRLLGAALAAVLAAGPAVADPVRIYAAGSLGTVLPRMIEQSGLPPGSVAPPVFGPAGALAKRLLAGEEADLLASADMRGPEAVAATRPGATVVPFARNRMCLLGRDLPVESAGALLDVLLRPSFRLATSTPVVDPGGDYALAVFDRADALHPGAAAILRNKALMLLGGPDSMAPQPGHSPAATLFLVNAADALLYYCSGADAAAREVPGLQSVPVPPELEVGPVYGLAVLSNRPDVARLVQFMRGERGQALLKEAGLLPLAGP